MSERESDSNQEQKQQSLPSTMSTSSKIGLESTIESHFVSPTKAIRLHDAQTGLPIDIYLEVDNTLSLRNVQMVYPNATTVKCILPDQIDPYLFPCENNHIKSPFGIWPDGIYEPVMPSYAVQPLVNLLQTQSRGYAPCQVANLYKPSLCLDAELLVDCGCSVDLILPSKEIEKLQLRKETGGISARGFNNRITILPKYEDVKITVNLKHPITGHITTKTAIISVFERLPVFTSDIGIQCSNDVLLDETEITASHLLSPQHSKMTKCTMMVDDNPEANIAILKLNPLKHAIKDGNQYGILGHPAMTKLNIGINFGGNYIFGVERLFEHISSISGSKAD